MALVVLIGLIQSLVLLHRLSRLFNVFCSTSEIELGNLPLMLIVISSSNQIQPRSDRIAVRQRSGSTARAIKLPLTESPWRKAPDTCNMRDLPTPKAWYNTSSAQHGGITSLKERRNTKSEQYWGYCFNQDTIKSHFDIKKSSQGNFVSLKRLFNGSNYWVQRCLI